MMRVLTAGDRPGGDGSAEAEITARGTDVVPLDGTFADRVRAPCLEMDLVAGSDTGLVFA